MEACPPSDTFCMLHIDAARNSTDDFNPFHDSRRWQRIAGNPFGGPIVLGFQLAALVEDRFRAYRADHDEGRLMDAHGLVFSNYEFNFANAVYPGQAVSVEIRKSRLSGEDARILSNRFMLRQQGACALIGFKRESGEPLVSPAADFTALPEPASIPDRSFIPGTDLFFKRKFLNTSNGKNFLLGSLVDQSLYFDEIDERVSFPEMFPVAYVSCALLERAATRGHDFMANPMVYASHRICVDRHLNARLRSNDMLGLLVEPVTPDESGARENVEAYRCYGLLEDKAVLFRALIELVPLEAIRSRQSGGPISNER